ncbi:Zinc finger protein ZFPM2 [Bagarius yarrelli]|uniref:Zinc finger protein ZFPM2 n=1 Tax=Bagarius yarrelli TaxID=175774 RepID=A0A556VU13_BAGYA|nr:Zinc finger protein ZFPM2 [Bagarius yarrelli]
MSKSYEYGILDKSAGSPKTGGGLASMLNAGHSVEVKGPSQFNMSLVEALSPGRKAVEKFPASVKKAATPSEAEDNLNSIKDSKNIRKSESESDHNQTTCEACKITFSRLENYSVHKQYYCASRHDPPAKRAANNKHVQKSFHTRKRKKTQSSDPGRSQFYPIGSSYTSLNTVESLKDVLNQRYNTIQGLVPKHPEASLTVTKSALVSKCNVMAEGEGDAPIDLSKKCIVQFSKVSGLMDYHECAMCKVSFNKVEDYLSHKQNSCPDTALENEAPILVEEPLKSAGIQQSVKETNSVMESDSYPRGAKKIRADEQIWPYYEIKPADYATGIFPLQSESRQSPSKGTLDQKEQPMPDSSHVGSEKIDHSAVKSLKSSLLDDDKREKESSTPNLCFTACTTDQESAMKPREHISFSPDSKIDEISSLQRSTNGLLSAAVNSKYCRPCDIQFNNLSNFITHKKFYCSAHTAEHVK